MNAAREDGVTPLLIAARNGHGETVSVLIEAGADVNAATQDGSTPLFIAARNGHGETVSVLIEAGADVNAATQDGSTPLLIAAYKGHGETVSVLIEAGADVNAATQDGSTPLLIAARNGHGEILARLVAAGCVHLNEAHQRGWCHAGVRQLNGLQSLEREASAYPHKLEPTPKKKHGKKASGLENAAQMTIDDLQRVPSHTDKGAVKAEGEKVPTHTMDLCGMERLVKMMHNLELDKFGAALSIIRQSYHYRVNLEKAQSDDEEIVIDISTLDSKTLWKLHKFVEDAALSQLQDYDSSDSSDSSSDSSSDFNSKLRKQYQCT
jgi:predicted component of type VI protein secretion system